METRFALHKPVIPLLRTLLEDSKTSCIVGLCTGAGGPVLAIYEALAADEIHVQFTLTDKFPNIPAFQRLSSKYPSSIRYIDGPVDATNVPKNLAGLRTMFNAFHHFAPRSAPGMTRSAPFRIGTVISGNRQVKSSHGSLLAKYRYRSRRFSLVKLCTQDRNRCSPSKLILPSAAISSSFLFPRA
jgi:hypothetical protein